MRDRGLAAGGWDRRINAQVVFQKLDVPLKHPVDLNRGSNAIVEPQLLRIRGSGWAMPVTFFSGTISIGISRCQPWQVFLCFPFLPPGFPITDDKEVRSVEYAHPLARCTWVVQFDWRRLIEILQDSSVMFHLVDSRQLDPMTFKLNRDTHFRAGIPTPHIRATAPHVPRRTRGPNVVDYRTCWVCNAQPLEPRQQVVIPKHRGHLPWICTQPMRPAPLSHLRFGALPPLLGTQVSPPGFLD